MKPEKPEDMELDPRTVATEFVALYGAKADMQAMERVTALEAIGDLKGAEIWLIITDLVREQQNRLKVARTE